MIVDRCFGVVVVVHLSSFRVCAARLPRLIGTTTISIFPFLLLTAESAQRRQYST